MTKIHDNLNNSLNDDGSEVVRFSFRPTEYSPLLARLEDGRILYNGKTFEKDFFFFHKLEKIIKPINNYRDFFLHQFFNSLKISYEKHKIGDPIIVKEYIPGLEEYKDLNYDQYAALHFAFSYHRTIFQGTSYANVNFEQYFYESGWKSIKPVYTIYKEALYKHYDDNGVYRDEYNPFKVGTYGRLEEYIEYDIMKKYNEFDINSKTNTYYLRYKRYNEFYYKDFKGKKFSTESSFDYSDEEIQFNFNNMVHNKTIKKYTSILTEKNVRYFNQFLRKIDNEKHVMEKEKKKRGEEGELNIYEFEELKQRRHAMLNDPANILILPVIDAYMELYRFEGFYGFNGCYSKKPTTNCEGDRTLINHEYSLFEIVAVIFFELSIEYQEMCAINNWIWDDFMEEVEDEVFDVKEDLMLEASWMIPMFYWFLIIGAMGGILMPIDNLPYSFYCSVESVHLVKLNHEANIPEIYFELATRKPKCLPPYQILPSKFYFDEHYEYVRRGARRGWLPEGRFESLRHWGNHTYDGVYKRLGDFGYFLGLWK